MTRSPRWCASARPISSSITSSSGRSERPTFRRRRSRRRAQVFQEARRTLAARAALFARAQLEVEGGAVVLRGDDDTFVYFARVRPTELPDSDGWQGDAFAFDDGEGAALSR